MKEEFNLSSKYQEWMKDGSQSYDKEDVKEFIRLLDEIESCASQDIFISKVKKLAGEDLI